MNSGQKKILIAIFAYTLVWNAQYVWEYLPGVFDFAIFVFLLITLVALVLTGVYQAYKYIREEKKVHFRLINIVLIAVIAILTYWKPLGLIDLETFEGNNILYARYKGVASCTTSIRLKEGNRFKKTSICFGTDHHWGNYEIVKDTIKFHYDIVSEENKQGDFAIMQISDDPSHKGLGLIYYYYGGHKGIPMVIKEMNIEKLK